ncbi:hypothetical protein NQ315_003168, partial [Exocentrus adspersus]
MAIGCSAVYQKHQCIVTHRNFPRVWNISESQSGFQYVVQMMDDVLQALLKKNRKYPIHTCTFVWGESLNRTFYALHAGHFRSHPPIRDLQCCAGSPP